MANSKRIYLDYAATTPVDPAVRDAMLPYLGEYFGNPSSVHSCGQEARLAVEKSRQQLARLIGAQPAEIVFTSGGTEADNTALEGVAYARRARGNHIITSHIEHHAVLECFHFLEGQGYRVTYLPVDGEGRVNPAAVAEAITPETILVSIMLANNEVGTVEPLREISQVAHARNVLVHTDAVQALGHLRINVNELEVDLLAMSAHKLSGPKGVGALYLRRGTELVSLLHGGAQERGRRASTENVPGIVGLGKAAELAGLELDSEYKRLNTLRDGFIKRVMSEIKGVRLNGHPTLRLPGNINISVAGASGEALLLNLDVAGVCASTGSACNSESRDPSHVLVALGLTAEEANSSLRLSLGKWTTEGDLDLAFQALTRVVAKLRAEPPLEPGKAAPGAKPAKFKGDGIIIFPDVAASIKGAKTLDAAGVESKLVAPPPHMRMGCDLALEFSLAKQADIEKLFSEKAVTYSRILPL
jgi:cysteine desulfurase